MRAADPGAIGRGEYCVLGLEARRPGPRFRVIAVSDQTTPRIPACDLSSTDVRGVGQPSSTEAVNMASRQKTAYHAEDGRQNGDYEVSHLASIRAWRAVLSPFDPANFGEFGLPVLMPLSSSSPRHRERCGEGHFNYVGVRPGRVPRPDGRGRPLHPALQSRQFSRVKSTWSSPFE